MVLLDTGTPGTSRENFSEDADDGTRTRNPSITNRVLNGWRKITSCLSLKIGAKLTSGFRNELLLGQFFPPVLNC